MRVIFVKFVAKPAGCNVKDAEVPGLPLTRNRDNMIGITILSVLIALTIAAVFVPRLPAVLPAYAAMLVCRFCGICNFGNETLAFWGVATLIALGITYMIPRKVAYSRVGVGFIGGGALAGAAVGMLSNKMAGVITGAAVGALAGGIAYARSAAGREIMHFPSRRFFNYLGAKGLPVVVAVSMAAACAANLLARVTPA